MMCLYQNTQEVAYALYIGKEEIIDSAGNRTGTYRNIYSDPIIARMNVSAARMSAELEEFGINTPYNRTIVTDDMTTDFSTDTVFWVGISPYKTELINGEEVQRVVPHNFVVLRVARSLNSTTLAVKEVDVS